MWKLIIGTFASFFVVSIVLAAPKVVFSPTTPPAGNPGNNITISPGMMKPGQTPGTPNPPQNPSQNPGPSQPAVIVTIPIGSSSK